MHAAMQQTQGKESKHRQLPVPGMAYAVAVLFAVHLVTYLIPSIRDATPNGSPIVADKLLRLPPVARVAQRRRSDHLPSVWELPSDRTRHCQCA
jgi:hypothetical protein